MKVAWDKKGNPRIEFSKDEIKDQDTIVSDARQIRKLLSSNEWKVLVRWFERGREGIIQEGMTGVSLKSKVHLSPYQWSVLKGFALCTEIPMQVLAKADVIEENKREEAKQNDSTSNEYGE